MKNSRSPHLSRLTSAFSYFRHYPSRIQPFLPPESFDQPPATYTGPASLYGQIRQSLLSLGILPLFRRLVGLRLIMTLRHFFAYSNATPSEVHLRYQLSVYYHSPTPTDVAPAASGANFVGYLRSPIGLGQASRSLLECAAAVNLATAAYSIDTRETSDQPPLTDVHPPFPVSIFGVNADQTYPIEDLLGAQFYRGHYNIGYWFWELAQFPAQWQPAFDRYDEIWVATRFVQAAIRDHTEKPVIRIPLSVEISLPPHSSRADFGLPESAFIVLYIFDALGTFERKNPWGVVEAFRQAFSAKPSGPPALLVIKASNLHTAPQDAERLRTALSTVNGILIEQRLSRLQTSALISHCNIYLSLHRSEGFGLTMAEAMFLGKPTIATAYSGNLDFMTTENSYLVPYTPAPLTQAFGLYPSGSSWAEPNIEVAAAHLRAVYDQPEQAHIIGAQAAQTIKADYNPRAVGNLILQRLSEIGVMRKSE